MSNTGATFYPGSADDYMMPYEVVAPVPQRVMPQVPKKMQQSMQRMELEARAPDARRDASQMASRHGRDTSLTTVFNNDFPDFGQQYQPSRSSQQLPGPTSAAELHASSGYDTFWSSPEGSPAGSPDGSPDGMSRGRPRDDDGVGPYPPSPSPSPSPFPKVHGEHIPPSDSDKEAVLAESREHVLHSNDPNMQICWARDVLAHVQISADAASREAAARNGGPGDGVRPAMARVEHELRRDAVNIVTYLADQGHPEAVFIRSKWQECGRFGHKQDRREAHAGYTQAAQQGWARAEYRIGRMCEDSKDISQALRHYTRALMKQDSAASYRVGMMSLFGEHSQPRNTVQALKLIHSAADSADEDAPQGAFIYGLIIARELPDVVIAEDVMSYDLAVARQYVEKAAYLGLSKAQLKMGQAHELCQLGCDFDPALSLHYYALAARQGLPEACLGVSRWFLFGYDGSFAKNEEQSYKYANLAAQAGLATGEFAMGYYHEIGIHVRKDLARARIWYEQAAQHGNKDAVGRLESLSQSKNLSKEDHVTTALARIKSQHGSQRGKRPERFKQNKTMPVLEETDRDSTAASSRLASGRPPLASSPQVHPDDDGAMPEPRHTLPFMGQVPDFTLPLASRSRSAAPYPEEAAPAPLNVPRSKSTVPYPEDNLSRPPPQLSHQHRSGARPIADREGSAFGIRSQSPGRQGAPNPAMRASQARAKLALPDRASSGPHSGRPIPASTGWQSGPPGQMPSGYRNPNPENRSASSTGQRVPQQSLSQQGHEYRHSSAPGGQAYSNAAYERISKANPKPPARGTPLYDHPAVTGNGPSTGRPPSSGQEYGNSAPRQSSRPRQNLGYDHRGGRSSATPSQSSAIGSAVPGSRPPVTLTDRPMPPEGPGRRTNDPPARPVSKTTASSQSVPVPPKAGPHTFEQMGVPQGKEEGECAVM